MNIVKMMRGAGAVVVGIVMMNIGCGADPAPSSVGGLTIAALSSVGKTTHLALGPGRPHDISNADIAGTVQFTVVSASSSDVESLLGSTSYYQDSSGTKIGARYEISTIKGSQSQIVTVRSAEPLAPNTRYELIVLTGSGVEVSDSARTGADRRWRMRLFTGSDPQFVAVSEDGSHIRVSLSEPVNLKDVGLAITSGGKSVVGCFETSDGCVARITASNVLSEEVSLRLTTAAIPQELELKTSGAALAPIQLAQGNWTIRADGTQTWRRPVTD
jgi:hypothetical protein